MKSAIENNKNKLDVNKYIRNALNYHLISMYR